MTVKRFALLYGCLMLFLVGCHVDTNPLRSSNERFSENLTQTIDGAGAERIVAETTNGNISVTGSVDGAVRVEIKKVVKASSVSEAEDYAKDVQVFVVRDGNAIRVYKDHPKFPKHVQVEVTFEIFSPANLAVDLRTLNGNIVVGDMDGFVEVQTTNGNVNFAGNPGYLSLRTLNGNIQASVAELNDAAQFTTTNGAVQVVIQAGVAPVSARTTNGSVDVTLPADFAGQLEAQTVNGRAASSFNIPRPTGSRQNRLFGTIGSGGETTVQLRAVNGSVNLWRL